MAINKPFTQKQLAFIASYMKHGNATRAYEEAGYSFSKMSTANTEACKLLTNPKIKGEILRRQKEMKDESIADAKEVMGFFTAAMRGEIKDQFGLEATLGDRIRAGQELAKRTVDLENRSSGKADANININLDFTGLD